MDMVERTMHGCCDNCQKLRTRELKNQASKQSAINPLGSYVCDNVVLTASWLASRCHLASLLTCTVLWILLLCLATPQLGEAAHLPSAARRSFSRRNVSRPDRPDGELPYDKYLMKFGYLPQSDMETGALREESEMKRAIRQFQKFANLPQTGNMDRATLGQMKKPRCGLSDVQQPSRRRRHRRYVLGPSKWEKRDLTFRIFNYTPDLGIAEVRDALYRAFEVWSDVTHLTFREVLQGEADMFIRFARYYHSDGYPFDGPGITLAHAFFPGEGRGGDLHFDDDETWTVYSQEGTNFFAVAAHEIGHALGLAHSSVPGSLMYPWYQGYNRNFQLHTDDIAGIQYLYGPKTSRPTLPYPTREVPRPRPPTTTTTVATPRRDDEAPDPCTSDIDAVSVIRGEVFMFKGKWFWRHNENGLMREGYPAESKIFWYTFPDELDQVDAVYERVGDGKIVFFRKNRYWVFNGLSLVTNFPKGGLPLTDLGFPADIKKIDAAFVWGHNRKTYFITDHMYWRYDESRGTVEYDYPRDMSMWGGVKLPVSAAFQYSDGRTYFFHGRDYYEFNDARMRVQKGYPQLMGPMWLGCSTRHTKVLTEDKSASRNLLPSFMVVLIGLLLTAHAR